MTLSAKMGRGLFGYLFVLLLLHPVQGWHLFRALERGARAIGDSVGGAIGKAEHSVGGVLKRGVRATDKFEDSVGGAIGRVEHSVGGAIGRAKDSVGGAFGRVEDSVGGAIDKAEQDWYDGFYRITGLQYDEVSSKFKQNIVGLTPAIGNDGYCASAEVLNVEVWQKQALERKLLGGVVDNIKTLETGGCQHCSGKWPKLMGPSLNHWSPDWTVDDHKKVWSRDELDFSAQQWQDKCSNFYAELHVPLPRRMGLGKYMLTNDGHSKWNQAQGKGCCEVCKSGWTPWGRECRMGLTCQPGFDKVKGAWTGVCVGEGYLGGALRGSWNVWRHIMETAVPGAAVETAVPGAIDAGFFAFEDAVAELDNRLSVLVNQRMAPGAPAPGPRHIGDLPTAARAA